MFRDKFWLSFALTIPILIWGHMLPRALGYTPPAFPGSHWIAPVLGLVVFLLRARGESVRDVLLGRVRMLREIWVGIAMIPLVFFVVALIIVKYRTSAKLTSPS